MTVPEKIDALRAEMREQGFQAYIIPPSDPHQSEYVADRWKCREWLTGFTGSAGIAVVTLEEAALWTDSRYFLQGTEQLEGTGIQLMKMGMPGTPSIEDWVIAKLKKETVPVVGCYGGYFAMSEIRKMTGKFNQAGQFLNYHFDLINKVWLDRDELPTEKAFEHDLKFAVSSRKEKLDAVRSGMGDADGHLITTLDDIAWIFNLRGRDVECNPVAIAYALVERERAYLFIDPVKVDSSLKTSLEKDNIFIKPYDEMIFTLKALTEGYKILMDPSKANAIIYEDVPVHCDVIEGKTVSTALKAIKSNGEVDHIRNAMRKDAVALLRLFRWLEDELDKREVPEAEVADVLATFRSKQEGYYGESFPAIVGYAGNGAIVHYRPMPETCANLKKEGILLLDSGGQYLDGTTDITRTVALGKPSQKQKEHYTLVLKGHICLATATFPEGTTGMQLDTLTRQFLWGSGLNFGHGTGHGVGYFLNVHEGPQGIGPNPNARYLGKIYEGMFNSNEPGLYITDEYGIRIENLVLAVNAGDNGFGKFLKMETLTLFPIDLELVEPTLLTIKEKIWLNEYHEKVWQEVSPLLEDKDERNWLRAKCRKL